MTTKSDTQKTTTTWTRMVLVLILGLSSTACQMPGGGGLASAAAAPKSPIGSLVGQTLGKGTGSLLGTKAGSKAPQGPSTKLPPLPGKKPADRLDFVGAAGRAALGAAGKSGGGIGVSKDQMGLNAKNPEVGPAAAAKGKAPAKTGSWWNPLSW
jgi:hypothetical protein